MTATPRNSDTGYAGATSRYTNGDYANQNPDWHQGDSVWKAEQIAQMMHRNALMSRTVVDVGCGAGEVLAQLQRLLPANVIFTGIEISPQALSLAQPKTNPNLSFHRAVLPDSNYDLLLLIDVCEHVEDPIGFLRSLHCYGRSFIIHIPLDLSVLSVLREWPLMKRRSGVGHLHYFTKATALATIEDAGYTVKDWFYPTGYREPAGTSMKTVLTRHVPEYLVSKINQDCAVRIFGEHSLMVLAV
jgi:SAM-dependent methyltransferase